MLVADCHVTRLVSEGGRVTRVDGRERGSRTGTPGSVVIVAAATIESARLALLSFPASRTTTCSAGT